MIRIVYTPVYDDKRHTKFVTEIDQSFLLDIKKIHTLSVISDVSGERLHAINFIDPSLLGLNDILYGL